MCRRRFYHSVVRPAESRDLRPIIFAVEKMSASRIAIGQRVAIILARLQAAFGFQVGIRKYLNRPETRTCSKKFTRE